MNRREFVTLLCFGIPTFSFSKMALFDVDVEREKPIRMKDFEPEKIVPKTIKEDKLLEAFVNEKTSDDKFLEKFTENSYDYLMDTDPNDVPLPRLPRREKGYGYMEKRAKLTPRGTRRLKLYNPHTKEHFDRVYFSNGSYNKKALKELNYFVRDFREKKTKEIDTELINLAYSIQMAIHPDKPLTLLSGYRTKKTNDMLRKKSKLVAKNSFHTKAKAFDIAPYDGSKSKLSKIKRIATNMKVGGVGYYRKNGFVHIDTGSVRYWG